MSASCRMRRAARVPKHDQQNQTSVADRLPLDRLRLLPSAHLLNEL